jgi:hypothetical protein
VAGDAAWEVTGDVGDVFCPGELLRGTVREGKGVGDPIEGESEFVFCSIHLVGKL